MNAPVVKDLLSELELDEDWLTETAAKYARQRAFAQQRSEPEPHPLPLLGRLLLNVGDIGAREVGAYNALGSRCASIRLLCRYYKELPEFDPTGWAARRRRILSREFHDFHSCLAELALHSYLAQRSGVSVRLADEGGQGGPDLVISIDGIEIMGEIKSRLPDGSDLLVDEQSLRAATRLLQKPLRSGQLPQGERRCVFLDVTADHGIFLQHALAQVVGPVSGLEETTQALHAGTKHWLDGSTWLATFVLDPEEYRVAQINWL